MPACTGSMRRSGHGVAVARALALALALTLALAPGAARGARAPDSARVGEPAASHHTQPPRPANGEASMQVS